MHDLDRTQREMEQALYELQPEQFEYSGEFAGELEEEYEDEVYEDELYEAIFNEAEEMEMAVELLEVTNEAELDHFLGKVIRRAGKKIGRKFPRPLGRALGSFLKPIAKAALPIAGKALGTLVGGPFGGAIGGRLGSAAGRLFGLELEGLSAEDREFELGKRFINFAGNAAKNALRTRANRPPHARAKQGLLSTMRRFSSGARRGGQRPVRKPFFAPIYPAQPLMGQNPYGDSYGADKGDQDPYGEPTPDADNGYGDSYGEPMPGGDYGMDGNDYAPMEEVSKAGSKRGTWVKRGRRIILLDV